MEKSPSAILIVGFGCIGQALLPLIIREFSLRPNQIQIIAADATGKAVADIFKVQLEVSPLMPINLESMLKDRLHRDDLLINLSVEVSSLALITWCKQAGVLYLDTCVEPWPGGYSNTENFAETTNYALREQALHLAERGAPTAVIAHGANPGLVTHFAKAGLRELAKLRGISPQLSSAETAAAIGVKVIQIAERDTQRGTCLIPEEDFVNTWSVSGFLAEALQCAEAGWGTHEQSLPPHGVHHDFGERSAIFMLAHGIDVRVKSWVPSMGEQNSYLIPHHEAASLASFLTVSSGRYASPVYRPTVYYAYTPSPATCQSIQSWKARGRQALKHGYFLRDELEDGFDELGVLFIGEWGAYWYGSTLSLGEARQIAPFNSATSMQVVAGILGALAWMKNHPNEGVVEAEDMNSEQVLDAATPFLGEICGFQTSWQPAANSDLQFNDFLVSSMPMEMTKRLEEYIN